MSTDAAAGTVPALSFSLRQLQYVDAIAECRNFRRAAERCGVSQPALSGQISELEAHLGLRLFDRGRTGVVLTAEGEKVLPAVRAVLSAAEALESSCSEQRNPFGGEVRIGVIPTLAPYALPLLRPTIQRRFPDLTVHWAEEKTAAIEGALLAGSLDGALLALPTLPELEARPLGWEEFLLLAPATAAEALGPGPVSRDALLARPVLLLDDGHCLRDNLIELCAERRAETRALGATSLSTLVRLVGREGGQTLLPRLAADVETTDAVVLRAFEAPAPGRRLGFVTRKRHRRKVLLRAVADCAKEALALPER